MSEWTTLYPREWTRLWHPTDIHGVWFLPKDWPGRGPTTGLLHPECEMQICTIGPDGVPNVVINRPTRNKRTKHWVHAVCDMAKELGAAVSFSCDTPEQAERAARLASKLLPDHERVAMERMYEAETRAKGKLM